jgi:hypothetical protein
LQSAILTPEGAMNAAAVGKNPQYLAGLAGIHVPEKARILFWGEGMAVHETIMRASIADLVSQRRRAFAM